MTLPDLPVGALRHLEGYLYAYDRLRAQLDERRANLLQSSSPVYADDAGVTRGRHAAAWSDPTFTRVVTLMDDAVLRETGRVLAAIDEVRLHPAVSAQCREVFDRWYGIGRRQQHRAGIMADLYLSQATVYRCRQVMLACILARLAWLLPEEEV